MYKHLPKEFAIVEDQEAIVNPKFTFKEYLKDNEKHITGTELVKRGKEKGAMGMAEAEYLLEHQDLIPKEFNGEKYLIFPNTSLRDSVGNFRVAYLRWNGDRWVLGFGWLDSGWDGDDLVACSEVSSDTKYCECKRCEHCELIVK